MNQIVVCLLLGAFALNSVQSQKVSAVLYSEKGSSNDDPHRTYLTFPSPNRDYSCLPERLQPASVCVNHGFFIGYEEANFTSPIYNLQGDNCADLPDDVAKKIVSYRMAGAHDKEDTITFFTRENLEGDSISPLEESDDLVDGSAYHSFIISGNSTWRFFMNKGFTGLNLCWDKTSHPIKDGVFYSWDDLDGLLPGDVGSFRKGC